MIDIWHLKSDTEWHWYDSEWHWYV